MVEMLICIFVHTRYQKIEMYEDRGRVERKMSQNRSGVSYFKAVILKHLHVTASLNDANWDIFDSILLSDVLLQ